MSLFTAIRGERLSKQLSLFLTILAAITVFLLFFYTLHTDPTATSIPSLRGVSVRDTASDAYTAKASSYDSFRAPSPGWSSIRKALKTIPSNLNILDLGCGSGAFLHELIALHPSTLEGVDRNQAMIDVALTRVKSLSAVSPSTSIVIRQEQHISQLLSSKYDIVFCAQVLQNLTPNPSEAAGERIAFMKHIHRILKPGGKAIVSTRAISPGKDGRYSHLYWYADPAIVPTAVATMELMVPRDPLAEMTQAGFVDNELLHSTDTVVRFDAYLNPQNLQNPAFRSADSFFQHVKENELSALLQHVKQLDQQGQGQGQGSDPLQKYVLDRDAKRGGHGHVVTIVGNKPTS